MRISSLLTNLVLIAVGLMAAGTAGTASAVLYSYEPFDYTVGSDVLGQNGGVGWSAAWRENSAGSVPAGSFTVQLGSLFGPAGLPTQGNSAIMTGQFGTLQPARDFAEVAGTAGTELWYSYIGQRQGGTGGGTATNPYMRGVNAGLFDSTHPTRAERVGVGNSSNAANNEWSIIPEGSGAARVGSGIPFSDMAWQVLKIEFLGDSTTPDNAYLWLNPDPSLPEPSIASAVASSVGQFDFSNVDFLRPFIGGQNGAIDYGVMVIDEIRLGSDWASMSATAVPEPSSLATLGAAAAAAVALARRRGRH